eukprot:11216251-Alexandrium_andersonii.AAC.1
MQDYATPITVQITDPDRWSDDAALQRSRSIFSHGKPDPVHWIVVARSSDEAIAFEVVASPLSASAI